MVNIAPRIVCVDGNSISIQAGKYCQCTPQSDEGPWTALEVGFPSCVLPDSWEDYQDGSASPVYMYVPVELIIEFINVHGGLKEIKLEEDFPHLDKEMCGALEEVASWCRMYPHELAKSLGYTQTSYVVRNFIEN